MEVSAVTFFDWPSPWTNDNPNDRAIPALSPAPAGPSPSSSVGAPPPPPQQSPLLVAGCHDGVHLLRVHIDDLNTEGGRAVAAGAGAVGRVEQLPFFVLPPPEELLPHQGAEKGSLIGGDNTCGWVGGIGCFRGNQDIL